MSATSPSQAVQAFVPSHTDTYPFIDPLKADLSGKSIFISGASKGVGRATAIAFAQAGASKIAIAARSDLSAVADETRAAAKAAGRPAPHVLPLKVDVADESSVGAAAAVREAFGGTLDVLIANAGYLETWLPIGESDPSEWWYSWEVNVKGTYLTVRQFLPQLLAAAEPMVVLVSSLGAHITSRGASAYQTGKFAVARLAEFLDAEYRDRGLVALSVHPGGIKTELALGLPEAMHALLTDTAELPAHAFAWLARDRREWLGGRYISCCWDMEELLKKKGEIVEKDLLKFRMTL